VVKEVGSRKGRGPRRPSFNDDIYRVRRKEEKMFDRRKQKRGRKGGHIDTGAYLNRQSLVEKGKGSKGDEKTRRGLSEGKISCKMRMEVLGLFSEALKG